MRKLVLRTETLAELTPAELANVAGAGPLTDTCVTVRCTGLQCLVIDLLSVEG